MAVLQQPFASLRDFETIGLASVAIQAEPILARRIALKAASGRLEPYLRKRYAPDFAVQLDPDFWDLSGMVGGAGVAYEATGETVRVMDVAARFTAGVVGVAGITYALNVEDGANGSVYGAALALPTSGAFVVQGYTFTLAPGATVANGDVLRFSLRTDAGLGLATVQIGTWILLGARGIDAKTLETMKAAADASLDWGKDLAKGDGELDHGADATPKKNEGGIRFTGEHGPRDWLRGGRSRWGNR